MYFVIILINCTISSKIKQHSHLITSPKLATLVSSKGGYCTEVEILFIGSKNVLLCQQFQLFGVLEILVSQENSAGIWISK